MLAIVKQNEHQRQLKGLMIRSHKRLNQPIGILVFNENLTILCSMLAVYGVLFPSHSTLISQLES